MTGMKKWSLAGLIMGALLFLAPLCGVLGTLLGMVLSFQEIATADGAPNPQSLGEGVQTAMFSTAAGLLLVPVGMVVFVVSLVGWLKARKRNPR